MNQIKPEAVLDKVNAYTQAALQDLSAYALRGALYVEMKRWDKAE